MSFRGMSTSLSIATFRSVFSWEFVWIEPVFFTMSSFWMLYPDIHEIQHVFEFISLHTPVTYQNIKTILHWIINGNYDLYHPQIVVYCHDWINNKFIWSALCIKFVKIEGVWISELHNQQSMTRTRGIRKEICEYNTKGGRKFATFFLDMCTFMWSNNVRKKFLPFKSNILNISVINLCFVLNIFEWCLNLECRFPCSSFLLSHLTPTAPKENKIDINDWWHSKYA